MRVEGGEREGRGRKREGERGRGRGREGRVLFIKLIILKFAVIGISGRNNIE